MCSVVPSKSTGEFIARRVVAFMKEVGCAHGDINMKSDNEEALVMLANNVARQRAARGGGRTNMENSPKYSSKSNGVVERAVQSVEGQMRVFRSSLEEKTDTKNLVGHAVWAWLAEYASYALNRLEVGNDGKTAYERAKGKKAKVMGVALGEKVLWKRRPI